MVPTVNSTIYYKEYSRYIIVIHGKAANRNGTKKSLLLIIDKEMKEAGSRLFNIGLINMLQVVQKVCVCDH